MEEPKIIIVDSSQLEIATEDADVVLNNDDEYSTTVIIKGYKGTVKILFSPYLTGSPRCYIAFEERT